MRIEEGKFYRTRDGRKAGPAKLRSEEFGYWDLGKEFDVCHEADGTYCLGKVLPDDLISEWTDEGPVRTETVTVRHIVPGVYGPVEIVVQYQDKVVLNFRTQGGTYGRPAFSAPELRELARVTLEIAEYLEDVD